MSSENPSYLQGSSTFENSKIDSIKGFDSSNQNKVLFQSSPWLSGFSNKENSIPNYDNFLNQEKNKERDDTNIYNQLGFDSEESKYENKADNKMHRQVLLMIMKVLKNYFHLQILIIIHL